MGRLFEAMAMERVASVVAVLALAAFWSTKGAGQGPRDAAPTAGLAEGPYATMHAELEKTILHVDVLSVQMRFGERTQAAIASLAAGQPYSKARADAVARAAANADRAEVLVHFERHVSLDEFLDAVGDDLQKAEDAGMIDERLRATVVSGMPVWFEAIETRGFHEGDELVYQAHPDALHTVLRDAKGRALVDQVDRGPGPKKALLAGYFAPGSTLQKPLVESVFPPGG